MHMTTSEFWSGLSDLLAQADSHPIDSRDEDSGYLHRDRDACLVREHLKIGMPLWPLIERDISQNPGWVRSCATPTKYEMLAAALSTARQKRTSMEESTPGSTICAPVVWCSLIVSMATAYLIRRCGK